MTWIALFLFLYFAWRGFFYFRAGRMIAGVLCVLACCLFLGSIYVDYARFQHGASQADAQAEQEASEDEEPLIGDYDPNEDYSESLTD